MHALAKAIAVIIAMTVLPLATDQKSPAPEDQLASLSWLAGAWEAKIWGGTFVSHYSTPDGGKVISYNRLLKDGEIAFYEFEVFEIENDRVVFHPFPNGKKVTSLPLVECDPKARKAVFENPDKDFPTRIVYHRLAKDNLIVTLSDPHHDNPKVERFDFKRNNQ